MGPALRWISGAAALLFLLVAAWLGALERGGPAHADLFLDGGIPATLYLPGGATGREAFSDPPPRGERPPALVLMHGFASDRLGMSALARRLAGAGYAVLAFDAAGHGQNRNPFDRSRARADAYAADMGAAVDFLRASPLVDGERIAVMGHSMGAGASLDFATRDQGLDATVLVSGGSSMHGPHRPPNALFIHASGDPARLKDRSRLLAARLAALSDPAALERGRTYGTHARRDAVRVVEVPGADHATIVWSEAAAREIVRWLDASFGRERREVGALPDPRLRGVAFAALLLLLLLPGLGVVIGRVVPRAPEPEARSAAGGLLWLAAALLATMPLLAADVPLALLSIEVGDQVVSHFALCGLALLVVLGLRGERPFDGALRAPWRVAAGVLLGVVAVYVLFLPIGLVVHRMTLTPERSLAFVLATLALLPFSLAFQALLRRGSPLRASAQSVAGRVLVVAMLLLGVATGLLSFVVVLMLPALVLVLVLFEVLAGSLYATSRNVVAIAGIDAAWLALVVSLVMPIRL